MVADAIKDCGIARMAIQVDPETSKGMHHVFAMYDDPVDDEWYSTWQSRSIRDALHGYRINHGR